MRSHCAGVREPDRVGVHLGGHEAGEMGHVDHERSANLVRDGAEGREVEVATVTGPAGEDDLRTRRASERRDLVHVHEPVLTAHVVGRGRVIAPRRGLRRVLARVASVAEVPAEHRVAGLQERPQDRRICARPRVGLHVGVAGTEKRHGALDRERLDGVDPLAGVVVAGAWVAVGVLGRQDRALRLEHGAGRHALGRDQVEGHALAVQLTFDGGAQLRVELI